MKRLRTALRYCLAATAATPLVAGLVFFGGADSAKAYSGYQFPCSGYGVTGYGFGTYVSGWGYHVAEDVCSQAGRPVYAVADGTVMYSAKTPDSYRWGNLILIQHNNGDGTEATGIYGHLSNDRRVGAGQAVSKGQLIGFVGPSWTSENGNWAAHLHFGLRTGSYGAAVGTYAPGIVGYRPDGYGPYAHPANYINGRQVVHDYQIVGVEGHGVYPKTGEYYVEFRLKNTGNTTWQVNGTAPMRLGTINPENRDSGFSVNMIGHGWASHNRIALMNDTAPGQVGVFRARFNNKHIQPGYYVERFAPVLEGQRWLPNKDLSIGVVVQPPNYSAQWFTQGGYSPISPTNTAQPFDLNYLTPGKKVNLKAFIRNTGDYAWNSSGPNPARLGTDKPRDRASAFATGGDSSIPLSENWPDYRRPSNIDGKYDPGANTITPTDTIQPGEIAVFSFTVTAPNQPGTYIEHFNPLIEGQGWLNDLGMWYQMRVLPPGHHYEWVTQENPQTIQHGRTSSTARVYLRNSGQTNWPVNGTVRLGTWNPRDRVSAFSAGWLSPTRPSAVEANVSNPSESIVRPGQVARFTFNVQAAGVKNGTYPEYVRLLDEGNQWFPEDYGIFLPITVTAPPRDYQVVSQSFNQSTSNLRYGDEFSSRLAIRNLGTESWGTTGPNAVKLGTERPRDRAAGFSIFANQDPWLSPSRASGIDGRVNNLNPLTTEADDVIEQGEIAYFHTPMKVPNGLPIGLYNEYYNIVKENVAWWPDLGIFFPLMVTGN